MSAPTPPGLALPEAWQPTLQAGGPPTQVLPERGPDGAVGRRTGPATWELFVVFDPAQALQLELDRVATDHIALHDLGSGESRRALAEIAAAYRLPLHRLLIRSQGYGTVLATLEFVELPTAGAQPLRLYSTTAEAETQRRESLARVLLAGSWMGVALIGAVAPGDDVLQPLQAMMAGKPWRNGHMLVCPLGGATALAHAAAQTISRAGVHACMAAPVAHAADLLGPIATTWNHLRTTWLTEALAAPSLVRFAAAAPVMTPAASSATPAAPAASPPAPAAAHPVSPDSSAAPAAALPAPAAMALPTAATSEAATTTPTPAAADPAPVVPPAPGAAPPATGVSSAPPRAAALPMQPMPDPKPAVERTAAPQTPLQRYVRRCLEVKGMISCCVFEPTTQRTVAFAGARPGPAGLATQGAALFDAVTASARALGLGAAPPETAITLTGHYLVLRPLPAQPGLLLHAVIDRSATPLVLALRHLDRLDELLQDPGA